MPISDFQAATLKKTNLSPASGKGRKRLSTLLMAAGIFIIAFPFGTEAYGQLIQYRLNRDWDKQVADQKKMAGVAQIEQLDRLGNRTVTSEDAVLEKATAPIRDLDGDDFPSMKIRIPKIGVEQVVLQGVGQEVLKNGPGHYPGTAFAGQRGNVGIAGHRVTYTRPFNRLDELEMGDKIILETMNGIYEYRVNFSEQLEPDDLSALKPTRDARVTLTTCAPKYSARYRLDVQASLVKMARTRSPSIIRNLVNRLTKSRPEKLPRNILQLAVERGREEVARDPLDPYPRINLAMIYRNTGQYKKAISELDKAIELNRDLPESYYGLALVYQKAGRTDLAIDNLKKALNVNSEFEPGHHRLGVLYLESNQVSAAVKAFKEALRIDPLSADTHFFLGQAYEEQDRLAEALTEYREAIKYVPDFKEAEKAAERLESRIEN